MSLKMLSITLHLNLSAAFWLSPLAQPKTPGREQFLKVLKKSNPTDVVYIFQETEMEDWSADIYRVFQPVYTISLERKGSLFREYSIIKDNDTVLSNENLYIISMRNFSLFEGVVDDIRHLVFWKARHRLVFITENDKGTVENFTERFKYCFKYWIINVIVVFTHNLEVAHTYNPFERDYFIEKDISEAFFDKTLNLHGFQLNITMFPEILNAREVNGAFEGIDGWMSTTVMDAINATYRYVVPSVGAVFGAFNETSADGALADIIPARTQVGFNSRFFKEKLYKVVEPTYCHRRNDLIVLVPIERANSLKNIFALTSPLTWVLVLGLAVLIFLYIYIFNKRLDFGTVVTVIVLVITCKPLHDLTFNKFRILFMSSMFLVFYITAEFNCRLTSVLTISFVPPPPSTLKELWETSRYKIKSRPSFTRQLTTYVDSKLGRRLMSSIEGLDRDVQIQEIMKCNKVIIISKRDVAKNAVKKSLIKDRNICYRAMKEIFIPNVQIYIVPYGSPFLGRFDDIIQRLKSNGIYASWEKGPKVSRKDEISKKPYRLSLDTLFVAFAVLGLGLTISMSVFLYEYKSARGHKS